MHKQLEQYYRENYKNLVRQLSKSVGYDAEDCIQETCRRCLEYGKEVDRFERYFRLVLRSVIIDHKKRQFSGMVTRQEYNSIVKNSMDISPEEILLLKENIDDIEQAIAYKKGLHKVILELAFLHQLTPDDISRVLATNKNYILVSIHRFRKELKDDGR